MTREVDRTFAEGLATLLGSRLSSVSSLGDGVLTVHLEDGRRLVAKAVARQSVPEWKAGRPWAELVALDVLSTVGAPVPKLVAADLNHGWLVTEYAFGDTLDVVASVRPDLAFASLVRELTRLEEAFAAEWEYLKPWAVAGSGGDCELAASITLLLETDAREAWSELVWEATDAVGEGRPDYLTPGPLDVQAANVVWGRRVTFLDMASYGYDVTEKRLSAYAQRAGKDPVSLLDARAYASYRSERGEAAALRLAFYDLLFWGVGLARLIAAIKEPDSHGARLLSQSWGDPARLMPGFREMWMRERLPDPRIERVCRGLSPMQEASPG